MDILLPWIVLAAVAIGSYLVLRRNPDWDETTRGEAFANLEAVIRERWRQMLWCIVLLNAGAFIWILLYFATRR